AGGDGRRRGRARQRVDDHGSGPRRRPRDSRGLDHLSAVQARTAVTLDRIDIVICGGHVVPASRALRIRAVYRGTSEPPRITLSVKAAQSPPATGYYRCRAWRRAGPRPTNRPPAAHVGDRTAPRPLADQGPRAGRRRAAARGAG